MLENLNTWRPRYSTHADATQMQHICNPCRCVENMQTPQRKAVHPNQSQDQDLEVTVLAMCHLDGNHQWIFNETKNHLHDDLYRMLLFTYFYIIFLLFSSIYCLYSSVCLYCDGLSLCWWLHFSIFELNWIKSLQMKNSLSILQSKVTLSQTSCGKNTSFQEIKR